MPTDPTDAKRPVQTTETAFAILEIVKENEGVSLTDVTDRTDLAVSTVHRHLQTLADHGYLIKDGDRYRTGMRFLEFGMHARRQSPLYQAGKAPADKMAAEIGEKVWLISYQNGRSYHLYRSAGEQVTETATNIGQRGYLHQMAAGKAILAHLPAEAVDEIIDRWGLPRGTANTITDRDDLFERLETIRQRGYAFNREESSTGFRAVGAPVTDSTDTPIGAVSISGPTGRFAGEYLTDELPEKILSLTNEIEINIRYA